MKRAALLLILVLAAAGCGRKEGTAFCSEGSLLPTGPAVQVDPGGTPREARIAVLGSGFAVFWSAGTAEDDTDLFGRAVGVDGILGGPERRLTQVSGRSDRIRVVPGAGGVALTWRDDRFGRNEALATIVSPALTVPLAPAVFRSGVIAANQDPLPAIAALGTGYAVVWNGRGGDGNDHLFAQPMDGSGAAVFAPVPVVASGFDRATAPVATTLGGALAVADSESRPGLASAPDVFAYVLSSGFTPSEVRFGQTGEALAPEIAGLGGLAALVFCSGDDLVFAAVDTLGLAQPERRLASGCNAAITAAGGSFLVSWTDAGGAVRFRAVRPDGSTQGQSFELFRGDVIGPTSVAWNGTTAGVTWLAADAGTPKVWFRPLSCLVGPPATPTP